MDKFVQIICVGVESHPTYGTYNLLLNKHNDTSSARCHILLVF